MGTTGGGRGTTRDVHGRLHLKPGAAGDRSRPVDPDLTRVSGRLARVYRLDDWGSDPVPWGDYPVSRQVWEQICGTETVDDVDGFSQLSERQIVSYYRSGGCHWMAAALHERFGWPVVSVGRSHDPGRDCDGFSYVDGTDDSDRPVGDGPVWCDCRVRHFMVEDPDGNLWDVNGPTERDVALRGYRDLDGNRVDTVEVPDEVFSVILESWRQDEQDRGAAGFARRHVSTFTRP